MRALSASQIIQIWEVGQNQSSLNRALLLLRVAYPEQDQAQLVGWTIGQRDTELLSLREQTFGSTLKSLTDCPNCQERLDFSFEVASIRMTAAEPSQQFTLSQREYDLTFRVPTQADLLAIAPALTDASSLALARQSRALLKRCLLKAQYQGQPVDPEDFPPEISRALSDEMAERDPQAEVLINLSCPACDHIWQSLFDIVSFFWAELSAQAKRLLGEVHVLARFYSWREADILSMSAIRRQQYLERASQ